MCAPLTLILPAHTGLQTPPTNAEAQLATGVAIRTICFALTEDTGSPTQQIDPATTAQDLGAWRLSFAHMLFCNTLEHIVIALY